MMDLAPLLGCSFASGDLFLETSPNGQITFALGAGLRGSNPVGRSWHDIVAESSIVQMTQVLTGLRAGVRAGPLRVNICPGAGRPFGATCYLLVIPERAPLVSWALSWTTREDSGRSEVGAREFLARSERVLEQTAKDGQPVSVALIDLDRAGLGLTADRQLVASFQRGQLCGARLDGRRYAVAKAGENAGAAVAEAIATSPSDLSGSMAEISVGASLPLVSRYALQLVVQEFSRADTDVDPRMLINAFSAHKAMISRQVDTLRERLILGRYQLAFQPVIHLQTGTLHHYEALLRLKPGESPFQSVRLAEELGSIAEMDRSVFQSAIKALNAADPDVCIAVNISGRSLMTEGFVGELVAAFRGTPAAQGRLSVEITESAELGDLHAADRAIGRLRRAGLPVALDDFGAGAASLAYLQRLHVDMVKIDGRYIRAVNSSERDATLVRHLVELCTSMGCSTVAEMIEDEVTAQKLCAMGVQFGQGWLFGRPQPHLPAKRRG